MQVGGLGANMPTNDGEQRQNDHILKIYTQLSAVETRLSSIDKTLTTDHIARIEFSTLVSRVDMNSGKISLLTILVVVQTFIMVILVVALFLTGVF